MYTGVILFVWRLGQQWRNWSHYLVSVCFPRPYISTLFSYYYIQFSIPGHKPHVTEFACMFCQFQIDHKTPQPPLLYQSWSINLDYCHIKWLSVQSDWHYLVIDCIVPIVCTVLAVPSKLCSNFVPSSSLSSLKLAANKKRKIASESENGRWEGMSFPHSHLVLFHPCFSSSHPSWVPNRLIWRSIFFKKKCLF